MTSFCSKKNPVVEVEFKLVWRNIIKDPLDKLGEETKDGKLGEMNLDTDSVEIKRQYASIIIFEVIIA